MNNSRFCKKQIIGPMMAFCRLRAVRYISALGRTRDLQGLKLGAAVACTLAILAVSGAKAEVRDLQDRSAKDLVEISFDYKLVRWGVKKLSFVIKRNKTGWFANKRKPVKTKTIEALMGSLTDLQPSASEEKCINQRDHYPQFRILLRKANSVIVLTSRSNCSDWAP